MNFVHQIIVVFSTLFMLLMQPLPILYFSQKHLSPLCSACVWLLGSWSFRSNLIFHLCQSCFYKSLLCSAGTCVTGGANA